MNDIYTKLEKNRDSDMYPFHMPGHKRQQVDGIPKELSEIYGLDITEITDFDNLHHAEGIILQAEQRAASLYGADETFFLIGGSTVGLLSAIATVTSTNKKLLLARNCHKAVYNAVFLNDLDADYIWPEILDEFDIQGPIDVVKLQKMLQREANYGAIVITSPTYDGITMDVTKIAELAHHYRIPLIVDEAHGAHFKFHERFPKTALEAGADLVINSVHKTLPCMTQTALLHVQGKLVDRDKLKRFLSIYQTSSPSYIMMASIDSCMNLIADKGESLFENVIALRNTLDEKTAKLKILRIMPWTESKDGSRISMSDTIQNSMLRDPGKLIISVKNTGMSGQELLNLLHDKYQLEMEMAAPEYVLGILTFCDREEGVLRLCNALLEIDKMLQEKGENQKPNIENRFYDEINLPKRIKKIRQSMDAENEWVLLGESLGKTSAEFVYLYPPDIPIIVPGEEISEKFLQQVQTSNQMGLNLLGLSPDKEKIFVNK